LVGRLRPGGDVDHVGPLVFTEDVPFPSPNAAATAV
jgi:hypothetical protein